MVKIVKNVIILFIIGIISAGCGGNTKDFVQQIIPPQNMNIPIEGTWEVTSNLKTDDADPTTYRNWTGKKIYFTRENALLGRHFLPHPTYQFKKVEGRAYLLYNHQAFPEDYHFDQREIQIINVTDNKNPLCEVIIITEEEIIIKIFNNSYKAKKISPKVNQDVFRFYQKDNQESIQSKENTEGANTGVLLGLRSPSTRGENYQYRTLWIGVENKKLFPIKEMKNIVFPRKNGFYEIGVERNHEEETLVLKNILSELNGSEEEKNVKALKAENSQEMNRKIDYIGNDYLSIEETKIIMSKDRKNKKEKSYLKMLAVDSLPNIKAIKISDLLGETGLTAMEEGINQLKGNLETNTETILQIQEENFGLERKMGYWFLRGRVTPPENKAMEWDYDINLIPSKPIVFYNELNIPWTEVKDRVPSAIDIFTSPGKDIALVVTRDEVYIYEIEQDKLKHPLETIPLKDGESIIMAEWATGSYVKNWNIALSKYILEENK